MTTVSMDNNSNGVNNSLVRRRRRRSSKATSAAPKLLASLLVFGLVLLVLYNSDLRFKTNQDREVSLLQKESLPQQQPQQQKTLLKAPGTSPQKQTTTTTTKKRIPTGPPKKIDEATMPTIYPPKKRQQLFEANNANATAKLSLAGFGNDEDQIAAMFDGIRSATGELRLEERTKYLTGKTKLSDEELQDIRNQIEQSGQRPKQGTATKRFRLAQQQQYLPSKKRKRRERETQLYLALKRGEKGDQPLEEDPAEGQQEEPPPPPPEQPPEATNTSHHRAVANNSSSANHHNNNNHNTTRRFPVKGSTKQNDNDNNGPVVEPKTREEIAQMSKQAKQAYYNSIAHQHKDSLQFMFESMRQNQMIDPDLETLATQLHQRETNKKEEEKKTRGD